MNKITFFFTIIYIIFYNFASANPQKIQNYQDFVKITTMEITTKDSFTNMVKKISDKEKVPFNVPAVNFGIISDNFQPKELSGKILSQKNISFIKGKAFLDDIKTNHYMVTLNSINPNNPSLKTTPAKLKVGYKYRIIRTQTNPLTGVIDISSSWLDGDIPAQKSIYNHPLLSQNRNITNFRLKQPSDIILYLGDHNYNPVVSVLHFNQ